MGTKISFRRHFRFVVIALILAVDCDKNRCYRALDDAFQPLADNLQSTTYQTFEQDPVKYNNYEEATFRALVEWPKTDDRMYVVPVEAWFSPC